MPRPSRSRRPARRSFWRSQGNSLLGSTLNQLLAFGLLGLVFAGMFLNDRYGIPAWMLVLAGIAAAGALHVLQRRAFRHLAWRRTRRRGPR